jgi:hypothetical protein
MENSAKGSNTVVSSSSSSARKYAHNALCDEFLFFTAHYNIDAIKMNVIASAIIPTLPQHFPNKVGFTLFIGHEGP